MKRKGFTLVEIMIVVAIIALLAAIAIPNLLRARVTANESSAQATLRTISTAMETFAAANNGTYPAQMSEMTDPVPPYVNEDYTAAARQGYNFTVPTWGASYCIQAAPAVEGQGRTYSIASGGVLTAAACAGG